MRVNISGPNSYVDYEIDEEESDVEENWNDAELITSTPERALSPEDLTRRNAYFYALELHESQSSRSEHSDDFGRINEIAALNADAISISCDGEQSEWSDDEPVFQSPLVSLQSTIQSVSNLTFHTQSYNDFNDHPNFRVVRNTPLQGIYAYALNQLIYFY